MEGKKSATIGSEKTAGGRNKTPGLPASIRLQRNLAEKERRDKLNGFISQLANLIPMVSNASKPLDKVSILRLAAAEMRLHFSCLNPKKYKKKPLVLPPAIISSLDLIEKTTGGFIMVTTLTGVIVFCSRSIEDYLGYQNIDVMGHKVVKYIYEDDIKFFESQVNSVVRSLKRTRKKTKVIKAHMLQKPLPRSTETCRPRNMIFKISVHQNDTSENGLNNNVSGKESPEAAKTRPQKDFGYSSVVLLFIEPVRFEPEIDITYIDSNQDVYFTRHGLQGEIIYADQRISTITGYMPHDVQGTSAYQYISSSDVPIALFAQKAMFTSPDGKGVIVYRLRIRDMRCIYLQSSGQIAYKESSNEISHFVCFNRLLSEDEGSQELKKFQQRYAPQIMAAKMIQVKQKPGTTSPTTELAFEQVMTLINSPPKTEAASTSTQTNTFPCPTISAPGACQSIADQKSGEGVVVSPTKFPVKTSNFVHSSQGHSTSNLINNDRSTSVTLNCTPSYASEKNMDVILDKPEQRLGGGPLRRSDCSSTLSSSPYKTANSDRKSKVLAPEQCTNSGNKLDPAMVNEKYYSGSNPNTNGIHQVHQNRQYISIKSQNKTLSFVNVNNNVFNGTNLNGTDEIYNNQSMSFDPTLPPKITFQLAPTAPTFNSENDNLVTDVNEQLSQYLGQTSGSIAQLSGSVNVVPDMLYDELIFDKEQNLESQISHIEDTSSLSRMYDSSSVSSLLKNPSVTVQSDLYDDVNYCHNLNSYPQVDSYNNYSLPSSISGYNNGANTNVYNELGNLNSKLFSASGMNGFQENITSVDDFNNISPMEVLDSIKLSEEELIFNGVSTKLVLNKDDYMGIDISGGVNAKTMPNVSQNNTLSALLTNGLSNGHELSGSVDWTGMLAAPTAREDISLNKELYNELETFFANVGQSSADMRDIPEFSLGNNSYSENSISSQMKAIYHQ